MIGYYVHHHGLGHRARALAIAEHLRTPVIGFSSLPAPEGWPGEWVDLPDDRSESPLRPEAGGTLHWAPLDHPGLHRRMGLVAESLAAISTMVVDVSAEVTLLTRLFGVRTAVVALRGERTDAPHRVAWDAAEMIIAPWTAETTEPWWPRVWTAKTAFVGSISRFDGRPRPAVAPASWTVLVVWGGGSDLDPALVDEARAATPGWSWRLRTPASPSPDLWRELAEAEVVVCHGGDNAVAEVAAASRPAVVVAQDRPFREQHGTAAALRAAGICVALDTWPTAESWPALLDEARDLGGGGWSRWRHGDGARRAAEALELLNGGRP